MRLTPAGKLVNASKPRPAPVPVWEIRASESGGLTELAGIDPPALGQDGMPPLMTSHSSATCSWPLGRLRLGVIFPILTSRRSSVPDSPRRRKCMN